MQIEFFWKEALGIEDALLVEALSSVSEIVQVKKGEILVRQGEVQAWITLIIEGVFRGYYLNDEGREVTDCFGFRLGEPAMACQNLHEPAEITVVAAADSLCLRFPAEAMTELCQRHPQLIQVYDMLLVEGIKRHQTIKEALRHLDLEGRYQWFLREYPGLIDTVRHQDIASFLGVTPQSLSRVRGRVKRK